MFRKCVSMAALCLTLALAGSVNAQLGQGKVLFEFWDNIGGTSVDNNLRTAAGFPDNPSSSIWADKFQSPAGRADNYGVRGRAFITPPETGEYTFWVAGDDNCQLWLSTNEDPANAAMIAQVASWTGVAEWTKEAGQKSAPVSLVAGQKYYLEGLMKEGGGGDSLDVGWAGPGIGDAPVVLAGQYCTAFIRTPEPIVMAGSPKPADGAMDVMGPTFEWTPGINAAQHSIYFGTSPELTAADLKNTWAVAMYYHMGEIVPGTTYYWRVDEIDAEGNVYTGNVWSFTATPLEAHSPVPADAAEGMGVDTSMAWTVGLTASSQIVYFSADQAAVAAGDAAVQVATMGIDVTTFVPAAELDLFTTYYWRVDQIDADGAVIAGPVWSFSTIEYLPIVKEATVLSYDNTVEPFITTLDVAVPADITNAGALGEMVINFTGAAPKFVVDGETISLTAAGADIWGTADQFRYAYKTLNGDGTMVARVVSKGTGSNEWAKGGVMIRQSLEAGSNHALMPLTGGGGNGASFQYRLVAGTDMGNADSGTAIPAPYWVKIERVGDAFAAYISADGAEWAQLGSTQTIAMTSPVYIGLAVTSHASGELRTFTFDSVAMTGDVTGDWATADIGVAQGGNDAAVMTVTVQDAAGAVAAVSNGDPTAIQSGAAQNWKLLLSDFVGVDLTNVASLQLSIGDGQVGGAGAVTINSIATMPVEALVDVTSPADAVVGVPNDNDWPGAEIPAYAFDDNTATKFLHFKGETEASGAIITPAGNTVVKGLSFTTANDAPERDPVAFELYGSQTGADDSWTLIASGDIVDFAGATAAARFTKNATPITFVNTTPYATYKIMVTAVRAPASANSMQVAEIELLGFAK